MDLIQIRIDERPVVELLDRLIARGRDMSTPFRMIAGVMAHAVEENFAQEGRPPWLPLAASTVAAHERRYGSGRVKILQDTGRLAASVTTSSDALQARMGTNTIYAAIHQLGGNTGRNHASKIPARPFLKLGDDDMEEIVDILERHLANV